MKVKWPVVREVSMVVRFCKVNPVFSGLVQSFSDFMDSSKGADERDSQEESEAKTQYSFLDNFNVIQYFHSNGTWFP
jgi:hypothetical protein